MSFTNFVLPMTALAALLAAAPAQAQSNAVTYQGELKSEGSPATGPFDFRFTVFDAPTAGTQISVTSEHQDVAVEGGLFTVQMILGSAVFQGGQRWLQVEVRPGASTGAYEPLNPRQLITAAPYSLSTRGLFVNPAESFVGIGRTTTVSAEEVFGIYRNTSSFGGMYIQTNDSGRPFYGYSENGAVSAYHYFNGADNTWRVNNGGDRLVLANTGNLGIATAAPTERLDVNGNARATSFIYNTARTHYLAVPGSTFAPSDSALPHTREHAANGTRFADSVTAGTFYAPINLPDGATIVAVDFWVLDNAAAFLTTSLIRRPNGQFGATTMSTNNSSNSAGMQQITLTPTLAVDNQNNSYYLLVTSADWQPVMALFSARVTYTVAGPD